jgi:hypothetical protein
MVERTIYGLSVLVQSYAMLCYAMLCCVYAYAVKKNDKDAGNITKGRKVEDKNIETDILCFVKRQKKMRVSSNM